MDMSAVLAYKSLFLANRTKGTVEQANEGKTCTAVANGARVAVTAAQTAVPLFAVTDCLARTAHNKTVQDAAKAIANNDRYKKLVTTLNADKTIKALDGVTSTVKFLSKLGVAANVTYAVAKCIDAEEKDKNKVILEAGGNCAGMYLFEKMYSSAVKSLTKSDAVTKSTKFSKILDASLPFLKSVKVSSILLGIGFVAASLFGCKFGEVIGNSIYDSTDEGKQRKLAEKANVFQNAKC